MIHALTDKQREQLEALYFQYRLLMYAVARRYLGNRPDLIQESISITLEQMCLYADSLLSVSADKQKAYICQMTRHACAKALREQKPVLPLDESIGILDATDPYESVLDHEEAVALLRSAEELPARDRELIRMRHAEGKTYAQIAERFKWMESTARSAVKRATDRWRSIMKSYYIHNMRCSVCGYGGGAHNIEYVKMRYHTKCGAAPVYINAIVGPVQ